MNSQAIVYVIDPDGSTRNALRDLLKTMNLRSELFDSGEAFLNRFVPSQHGCLVLEVRIPDINGLEIQARLFASGVPIPLVFLAEYSTVSIAVRAMRAGARHFLEKPFREHELWDAIEESLQWDRNRRIAMVCQNRITKQAAELSDRERDILQAFAEGKPKRMIASELGICVRTVDIRLREIMNRLELNSRAELMRFAVLACDGHESQLVPLGRLQQLPLELTR